MLLEFNDDGILIRCGVSYNAKSLDLVDGGAWKLNN